jgi:hypothetical protein
MAVMVAAGHDRGFEFFAQPRQKSLAAGAQATKQLRTKKPAERRAVKSKETLKNSKN